MIREICSSHLQLSETTSSESFWSLAGSAIEFSIKPCYNLVIIPEFCYCDLEPMNEMLQIICPAAVIKRRLSYSWTVQNLIFHKTVPFTTPKSTCPPPTIIFLYKSQIERKIEYCLPGIGVAPFSLSSLDRSQNTLTRPCRL